MRYYKDRPIGLWILSVWIVLFIIYYYSLPFLWGGDLEAYSDIFTISTWSFFVWFNIALDIILVYAVTIGFYKGKNWARIYTIAIFSYSSFWNLYLIFIEKVWPYERYFWQVFYVIVIVYLMMSWTKEYFKVKSTL
jgi:hypothetical protein